MHPLTKKEGPKHTRERPMLVDVAERVGVDTCAGQA